VTENTASRVVVTNFIPDGRNNPKEGTVE